MRLSVPPGSGNTVQRGVCLEDSVQMGDIWRRFVTRDGWRTLIDVACVADSALLYVKCITWILCRAEYSGVAAHFIWPAGLAWLW